MTYDVIISGASFAGLAVAQRLGSDSTVRPEHVEGRTVANGAHRVLLIDKDPIGQGVTSACGAPVSILRAMGAEGSIQQVHDRLVLHTDRSETIWPIPDPFCTFDYQRFCRLAFEQTQAAFVQASVLARDGTVVSTSAGALSGRFLVDATGWRAVLTAGPEQRRRTAGASRAYVKHRWMAFGIESEVETAFEPGLHFYFLPEVRDGYAWVFPSGTGIRFGVLSYLGRTKLIPALETFMKRFGLRPGGIHGGYIASGLREPVVDGVFVAGDASGHCLPLTGEGIRTATLAGFRCGELLQRVLEGDLAVDEAADAYRVFAASARRKFRALLWANMALLALPLPAVGWLARTLARPIALQWIMRKYLAIFATGMPARAVTEAVSPSA